MDSHFFEFWGDYFTLIARGQRQLETLARWIQQGYRESDDPTEMFRKFYGLDHVDGRIADYGKMWEKAVQDFQKSFKESVSLFGLVPQQEYLTLAEKCEALEQKIAVQEETIERLKGLLREKVIDPEKMVKNFQKLMKKQGDQFQQLTKIWMGIFK